MQRFIFAVFMMVIFMAFAGCDSSAPSIDSSSDEFVTTNYDIEEGLAQAKHASLESFNAESGSAMLLEAVNAALADSTADKPNTSAKVTSEVLLEVAPTPLRAVVQTGPETFELNLQVHILEDDDASTLTLRSSFIATFIEVGGFIEEVRLSSYTSWPETQRILIDFFDADNNPVDLRGELDYINLIGYRAGTTYAADRTVIWLLAGELYRFRAQGEFSTGRALFKGEYEVPENCNGCRIRLFQPEQELTVVIYPATLVADEFRSSQEFDVRIESDLELVAGGQVDGQGYDFAGISRENADEYAFETRFPTEQEFDEVEFDIYDVTGGYSHQLGVFEIDVDDLDCEVVFSSSPNDTFYDGSYLRCIHEDLPGFE